jgi:hypothetical protein
MGRGSQGIKLLLFLYLLPCSRICRRDSCSSSRASSSGGRSSSSKGPFGSLPLRRRRVLLYRCTLRSRITPTVWRPPHGRIHDYTVTKRQPSPAHEDEGHFVPQDEVQAVTVAHFVPRKRVAKAPFGGHRPEHPHNLS